MSYRVFHNFKSGVTQDILNKAFPTRGEAYLAAMEATSNYSAGEDALRMVGMDFVEDPVIDWEIVELKK